VRWQPGVTTSRRRGRIAQENIRCTRPVGRMGGQTDSNWQVPTALRLWFLHLLRTTPATLSTARPAVRLSDCLPPSRPSHLIPSYPLLPHRLGGYICDVGTGNLRSYVTFSWYCPAEATGLAWPSVSVRCTGPTRVGAGSLAGAAHVLHPLRSIPSKRGVL